MHKISNRIFEIFFKKTLDFLLAGFHLTQQTMPSGVVRNVVITGLLKSGVEMVLLMAAQIVMLIM